jgi:hypothetical protein
MDKYFLFGRDACILMDEQGIEAFKDSMVNYATFKWVDGKSEPIDLLYAYDGWEEYCVLTEDEYHYIENL